MKCDESSRSYNVPASVLDQPPVLRRLRQRSPPELKKPYIADLPDTPPGKDLYIPPSSSLLHPYTTLVDEETAFQNSFTACYDDDGGFTDGKKGQCLHFGSGGTSGDFFIPLPFDDFETGSVDELDGATCFPRPNFRAVPQEILELPGSEMSSLRSSIQSSSSRPSKNYFDLDCSSDGQELKTDSEMARGVRVETGGVSKTSRCEITSETRYSNDEPLYAESRRYFVPIRPKASVEGDMADYFGTARLNEGFSDDSTGSGYGSNETWGIGHNDFTARVLSPPDVPSGLATVTVCNSSKYRFVQRKKIRTVSIDHASVDMRCISSESENKKDTFDHLISPRRKIRSATLVAAAECTATRVVAPTPFRLHGYDHEQFENVQEVVDHQNGNFGQQLSGDSEMDDATGLQNIVYSEYHRMLHSIQCDSPRNGSSFTKRDVRKADL